MTIEILHYMGGVTNTWLTYDAVTNYTFTDDFLIITRKSNSLLSDTYITHVPKEQILLMEVTK